MKKDIDYIKNLEDTIAKFMKPINDIPFPIAIKAISGFRVLSFNQSSKDNKMLLDKLIKAILIAGKKAYNEGIFTNRPNEAGNKIEPYVKTSLHDVGLEADTPVTRNGKKKATGYPDIEIIDSNSKIIYFECKTYNIRNIDTTQRAFYFSPSKNFKVTKDAFHLMVSFQLEKEKRGKRVVYIPVHWRIYTLENLTVSLKHEFNQSNRKLYGSQSDPDSLLSEGTVEK